MGGVRGKETNDRRRMRAASDRDRAGNDGGPGRYHRTVLQRSSGCLQHVTTIVGSNAALLEGGWLSKPRREIDNETVARADVIVSNSRASVMQDRQGDLYEPIQAGIIKPEDIGDLADLVAGKIAGRTSPDQITLHKNNNGLGCAEMALAKLAYQKAVAAGRGLRMELAQVEGG